MAENKIMFAETRRKEIESIVNRKKAVTVEELCQVFEVSKGTIRKDLLSLEEAGKVLRTHGGAIPADEPAQSRREMTTEEKEVRHIDIKERIASAALDYVRDGDVIALDTGTTTYELAKKIAKLPNLTIITNDLAIAGLLERESEANVIFLGGTIRKHFRCTIGQMVINSLKDLYVDTVFIATNGMSAERGFSTPSVDMADVKKAMIGVANKKIVLADSSKVNREAFVSFAQLEVADYLITDQECDTKFCAKAEDVGLTIISV